MKIKYKVINIDTIMFCQSTNLILTERARAACCCYGYHLRRTQFLASVFLAHAFMVCGLLPNPWGY